MRCINTATFERKVLQPDEVQKDEYAILSHRWLDEDEITYSDYSTKLLQSDESLPALLKIRGACKAAQAHGARWIWIDNVCIDKSSSAELTESINSMFRWYPQAKICLVFLNDTIASLRNSKGPCVWFTRGWTLQELLVPLRTEFYDSEWHSFGTKVKLAREIAAESGIEACYIDETKHFRTASIATRLSWIASRTTTRVEDMAYSLIGILGVSLDARYGEGQLAFMRLQEELLRNQSASDESLFAWTMPPEGLPLHNRQDWNPDEGLLAPYPQCFLYSGDITVGQQFPPRPSEGIVKSGDGVVFPMTLKEYQTLLRRTMPLHFILPFSPVIIAAIRSRTRKEWIITLNCWRNDPASTKGKARPVTITLVRDQKGDQYFRRGRCFELGLDMKMSTNDLTRRSRPVTVVQPNILD